MMLPARLRELADRAYVERRWIWLAVELALLAWMVHRLAAVGHTLYVRMHELPHDGRVDLLGARCFLQHKNPYDEASWKPLGVLGFGHPPTTPFWFLPLASVAENELSHALAPFVIVALAVHCVVVARELRLAWPALLGATLAIGVLSTSWMIDHLSVAQCSELIALAYVIAWVCLRRDRDVCAGLAIGAACTFKLFPGVMVLMLVVARRWRAVAAAAGAYLSVALLMTMRYGLAAWWMFIRQQRAIADMWIGDIRNGSLYGIVLRAFMPVCTQQTGPTTAATATTAVVSLALIGGAAWITRGALRAGRRIDLPFALWSVISVEVNPWVWEHYGVLLILPLLILVAALWRAREQLGRIRGWALALGGSLLACAIARTLAVEMSLKRLIRIAWFHGDRSHHLAMHVYEVLNWAPWVALLAALFPLAAWAARHDFTLPREPDAA
jgi:hypothetical protein